MLFFYASVLSALDAHNCVFAVVYLQNVTFVSQKGKKKCILLKMKNKHLTGGIKYEIMLA